MYLITSKSCVIEYQWANRVQEEWSFVCIAALLFLFVQLFHYISVYELQYSINIWGNLGHVKDVYTFDWIQ